MSEPLDELIQRVLDGDATAADKLRLEQRLASDAQARNRYDELARVFDALSATQLEEAPAGLRDDVLRSVREAALARSPAAARTGARAPVHARRPAFPWLRFALPVAAGAAAALLFFSTQSAPPWRAGDRVSGTMSEPGAAQELRLGSGPGALRVSGRPAGAGFELRLEAGDAPVRVRLETSGPGASLALAGNTASPTLEAALAANSVTLVQGLAGDSRASVRVLATFAAGQVASGELLVTGLRPQH